MRLPQTFLIAGAIAGLAFSALDSQAQPRPAVSIAVSRPGSYLGVGIQEIDADRAKALNLHEVAGVEVTRVEKDSPAEKAGLMNGDVVLQYAGQHVEGIEQFSRLVRETPAGRDVKLDLWRNGAPQTATVKVAMRRLLSQGPSGNPSGNFSGNPGDGYQFTIPEFPPMPDLPRNVMAWRTALLGVEAETLDGQLAQFFGVKEGVLVRSVGAGSPAEQAGIKAGDVIVRVDDTNVKNPTELSSRLRTLRGKSVGIVVTRDHKELTLNVMIADQAPLGGSRANRAQRLWNGEEF